MKKKIVFLAVLILPCLMILAEEPVKSTSSHTFNHHDMKVYDGAEIDFSYGDYQIALPKFLKLIEKFPDDLDLNFYVGLCYYFLKENDKAAPYLEKASTCRTLKVWIRYMAKTKEKESPVF